MKNEVRVLLVEGNRGDACLIQERAEEEKTRPLSMEVRSTFVDGLAALEGEPFDVVLLDLGLPDSVGLETFKAMYAAAKGVPIMVLSGRDDLELANECIALGAHDYLVKGRVESFLAGAIYNTVARAQAQRNLEGSPSSEVVAGDLAFALHKMNPEQRWRSSEGLFQLVYNQMAQGVVFQDPEGKITAANPAAEEILGLSLAEMQGRTSKDPRWRAIREDGSPFPGEEHPAALTLRTGGPEEAIMGVFNPKKDEMRWIRVHAVTTPCEHEGRPHAVFTTFEDITDLRHSQEALAKSEAMRLQTGRLEAIGRLAGGVAHDFNNLLTVINSYATFAADSLREGDPLRGDIEQILDAGHSAAALTRHLLAFSRKQMMEPKVVCLNDVVASVETMLRRILGEDIVFHTVLEDDLDNVRVDPGQLEQVLMNLVVNARDAMPEGGELVIETANVTLDEAYTQSHPECASGPCVLMAVTDTGHGMSSHVRDQVFEPFFTTKEKGKGTGLGLATVYGIVKQSGGDIWVESEEGQGTTFRIYLHRVEDKKDRAATGEARGVSNPGHETVLVVEDEEAVRELAKRILESAGYRVLSAANGGAALLECESHQGPIHLLVTDMVMPKMSGKELATRLKGTRPEMRVVYMSGYTDNAIGDHGFLDEDTPFIGKPFDIQGLLDKVREVLEA